MSAVEVGTLPGASSRARRIVALLLLAAMPLALAYAVLIVVAMVTTSFQNRALDFTPYYAAAAALHDNPGANIYDRAVLLRAAAEHPGCLLWPGAVYLYPPLLAIVLVPLTYLPYDAAFHWWMALNLALWVACVGLLAYWLHVIWYGARAGEGVQSERLSSAGASLRERVRRLMCGEPDGRTLAVLLAVVVAVPAWPVLEGLLMGQVHLLVLFLLLSAPLLVRRGHPLSAGGLLALAVMIKLLPVVLILYYAAQGRRRVVLGALLGTALLLAGTVLTTGVPLLLDAGATLGELSSRQDWYANQALAQAPALLAAAFGVGAGAAGALAGRITLALAALIFGWMLLGLWRMRRTAYERGEAASREDDVAELLGYGWAVCSLVILTPLVWPHFDTWLLCPLVFCLGYALREWRAAGPRRLPGWTLPLLIVTYVLTFLPWSAAFDTTAPAAGPHLMGVALSALLLLLHPASAVVLWAIAGWMMLRAYRASTRLIDNRRSVS
jgi:Glycosyltransferase family 87